MDKFYSDLEMYSSAHRFWLNEAIIGGDKEAMDIVGIYSKVIIELVKQRAKSLEHKDV